MATRFSIEMDFNQAMRQADRLDELAEQLRSLSDNKFNGTLQNISSGWKGENATAYLAKGTTLKGKMTSTAGELSGIASDIRTIARRVYEAEMRALELASTN